MRRTHATLMNQIRDDPKPVAGQPGQAVDVNQNVPEGFVPRRKVGKKVAGDALESALPVI
jgi:hypothetical protein